MASITAQPVAAETKDQAPTGEQPGKYLLAGAAVVAAVLGAISAVNFYMDPLWYDKGNPLPGGVNYVLDERTTKPTRLAGLDPKPDCLLFGTSSGSLMNFSNRLAGGNANCFNLAISKGHSDEFVKFADWANTIGIKPKTVIFELDAVSLMHTASSKAMPEWVLKKQSPPSPFLEYISFQALIFSTKTALKLPSLPRYYDKDFNAQIHEGVPPYDPTKEHAYSDSLGPFHADGNVGVINTFRRNWPGVKVICYAAPFAPEFTAEIEHKGTLGSFVGALWEISKQCDSFRDFNIPTELIADPLRTYDGIHYTPDTNSRMVDAFFGGSDFPRSDISGLSLDQYQQSYRAALAELRAKGKLAP